MVAIKQLMAILVNLPLAFRQLLKRLLQRLTLTVAQITGGLLVANPDTSAATYTLPTTVATEAVVTNAKVDSTFELNIVNLGTSSGALTIAVGTGWTLVGSVTVAITSSARFLARKTGAGTWTLYRVA